MGKVQGQFGRLGARCCAGGAGGNASDIYSGLDRFGRVIDQKWTTGTNGSGGTVKDEYTYTYDRDSNVTQKKNVTALQTPYAYSPFDEGYAYDGLNRLVAVSRLLGGASGNQSFALDPLGNITSVTTDGTAVARSSDSDNQLVSINGNVLTYAATGNMTTDDQGDTYVYDAWNRMVAVNHSDGTLIAAYTYDGLGRRISETTINSDHVPVTTDLYYSAGWQVLEEDSGGQTVLRNVWSPVYVNALVLRDRDTNGDGTTDERVYATQDANFNETSLVNTSGDVLEHFVYQAGGLHVTTDNAWTVQSGETLKWQVTYQGGEESLVTGLVNFQHRDYNPRTLTWNTQDPIQDGANWHEFDAANPINRRDPAGLWISSFEGCFTPDEMKAVRSADAYAIKTWSGVLRYLSHFDLAKYIADNNFDAADGDYYRAKALLGKVAELTKKMLDMDANGIKAKKLSATSTTKIALSSYWWGGLIEFYPSFFTDPESYQGETILHEMSHITFDSRDWPDSLAVAESLVRCESDYSDNMSVSPREEAVLTMLDDAYWWEALDNGPPSSAIQHNLLAFLFWPKGSTRLGAADGDE